MSERHSTTTASPASQQAAQTIGRRHTLQQWATLGAGIIAISFGSILIRLADAPPLVIAAWRMLLATIVLTPWAWPRFRAECRDMTRGEAIALVLAGVSLAVHMSTWVASLSLTTVASSVILVQTNPIFVALASRFLLKEHISRLGAAAIALTMLGTIVVSYGDLAISGSALIGDLLAVAGAIGGSAYILFGRTVRRRLSTIAYVWPCYGIAAVLLLALCLVAGQSLTGYSGATYLVLLGLALVPQVIGHSVFNWALSRFSIILVTLALLGEPIGATILAVLILGETPPATALLGSPLVMLGIYLAARAEQREVSPAVPWPIADRDLGRQAPMR